MSLYCQFQPQYFPGEPKFHCADGYDKQKQCKFINDITTMMFNDVTRSHDMVQSKKQMESNTNGVKVSKSEDGACHSNNPPPTRQSGVTASNKHLPSASTAPPETTGTSQQNDCSNDKDAGHCSGYTTATLPGATVSLQQNYGIEFDKEQPVSEEEKRKNILPPSDKKADYFIEALHKDQLSVPGEPLLQSQKTLAKSNSNTSFVDRPPRFPRRACVVYKDEQYSLDAKLLSLPASTKYLLKERKEICPGRYVAKLELHSAR